MELSDHMNDECIRCWAIRELIESYGLTLDEIRGYVAGEMTLADIQRKVWR